MTAYAEPYRRHLEPGATDSDPATREQYDKYRDRAGGPIQVQSRSAKKGAKVPEMARRCAKVKKAGEIVDNAKANASTKTAAGDPKNPIVIPDDKGAELGPENFQAHLAEAELSPRVVALRRDGLVDIAPSAIPAAMLPIFKRNYAESPFLRLPGELRNIIYEHTLISNTPLAIKYQSWKHKKRRRTTFIERQRHPGLTVGLTRVCRLIYAETKTFLYLRNTFLFTVQTYPLRQWTEERLPAQLHAVRRLQMHYNVYLDGCQQLKGDGEVAWNRLRDHFPGLEELRITDNPAYLTNGYNGLTEVWNVVGCNERSLAKLEEIADEEGERGKGGGLVVRYSRWGIFDGSEIVVESWGSGEI